MIDALPAILLVVLAALLLVAAAGDVRRYRISNGLNIAVAALAPLYWLASGYGWWPGVGAQLIIAAILFLIGLGLFAANAMGGGDVKLIAALGLWVPYPDILRALFIMALAGGLLSIVALLANRVRRGPAITRLPYGVAIACGGLVWLGEHLFKHFAP